MAVRAEKVCLVDVLHLDISEAVALASSAEKDGNICSVLATEEALLLAAKTFWREVQGLDVTGEQLALDLRELSRLGVCGPRGLAFPLVRLASVGGRAEALTFPAPLVCLLRWTESLSHSSRVASAYVGLLAFLQLVLAVGLESGLLDPETFGERDLVLENLRQDARRRQQEGTVFGPSLFGKYHEGRIETYYRCPQRLHLLDCLGEDRHMGNKNFVCPHKGVLTSALPPSFIGHFLLLETYFETGNSRESVLGSTLRDFLGRTAQQEKTGGTRSFSWLVDLGGGGQHRFQRVEVREALSRAILSYTNWLRPAIVGGDCGESASLDLPLFPEGGRRARAGLLPSLEVVRKFVVTQKRGKKGEPQEKNARKHGGKRGERRMELLKLRLLEHRLVLRRVFG